jgi:hypothetical protein
MLHISLVGSYSDILLGLLRSVVPLLLAYVPRRLTST